uniref:Uncharacterized protein n=1 Tax=Arundo donax TaxID=35708 RepID=A0A0A9GV10_ARUDO
MVSPSAFLVLQQRILSVIQNFPWPMASRCNNQRCHSTQSFHCSRQPQRTTPRSYRPSCTPSPASSHSSPPSSSLRRPCRST